MFINLSLKLSTNHPLMKWAKQQKNPYIATGHVGTHLDVYNKSNIPMDYFKNSLAIIDIPNQPVIDLKDIDTSSLKGKEFILFKTHHMDKYSYGEEAYFNQHPELSEELIDYLCNLDFHFIGIDTPGIKNGKLHEVMDRKCEENGIYVIENICNLDQIDDSFHTMYVTWDEAEEKTGYPCFLIAENE